MLLTSAQCLKRYGTPSASNPNLVVWYVPKEILTKIHTLPIRIFINKDMIAPLTKALQNVITEGLEEEIKTYDGCFQIRNKRGLSSMSLHSWACAIDFNYFENQLGKVPKMSKELVSCFERAGFDWGGYWSRPDGMHFQLKS